MACSCKSKAPALVPVIPQQTDQKQAAPVKPKERVNVQYTFTADTQPLDSCPYCAQKHLAAAAALILQRGLFGTYQASGQLLLASYHLPHYPQTASKLRSIARSLLDYSTGDVAKQFQQMIPQLQSYLQNPKEQKRTTLPDIDQQDHIDAIIHAAAAYQLMKQPYYQLTNKVYAIGQLCVAAMIMRRYPSVDGAYSLRKVWKLLQQIKSIDDPQYSQAMQILHKTILSRLQS